MFWLPNGEKTLMIRYDRILACDRQTNGQTDSETDILIHSSVLERDQYGGSQQYHT